MSFRIASMWEAPEVNPVNGKARSIPMLNPINKYGRVYFFSWFGFMIAFLAWYAFPPLLSDAIKHDLKLSQIEIANSNIIALTATLLVRLVAGPACDAFGPRITFAACLLLGAIPSVLSGTIHNAMGLYFIRFFVGILGGSFVPCQVWSTGFFDKNVVGSANSLTAGLGNAGGGITYFVMPAVYDSLRQKQGLSEHVAWRVSFIVPFILITSVAIALFLLCEDTPTGKWSERHLAVQQNLQSHGHNHSNGVVNIPGGITDKTSTPAHTTGTMTPTSTSNEKVDEEAAQAARSKQPSSSQQKDASLNPAILDAAKGEVIQKPSFREAMQVIFTPQTLVVASCYFCTFGAELAINSILGAYYLKQFPRLGQTGTGNWAAMFGLLNVVFRPLGGIAADFLYKRTTSLWSKKVLLHALSILCGVFQIIIGVTNPASSSMMFGLIAGMAFFLEAGNGANFALVPHVHPYANGIISGVTGACGNLGGIVFAIIFRQQGRDYARTFWVIGVMTVAINVAICWIRPVGGRK
ncbi:hypothetical protein HYALB_00004136 [Hymenoscyphus albidus]|uniref:Nitrate/nitrite transporter n=1 Tax=Hymenoscyphus albidus TaxID=595503 RepID=A0A9N9LJU9_9HELO|nr:hypothetical protein HYALB_00004136 [Hymenoscyphus albidus]